MATVTERRGHVIRGELTNLRAIERTDAPALYRWFNEASGPLAGRRCAVRFRSRKSSVESKIGLTSSGRRACRRVCIVNRWMAHRAA